MAIPGNSVQPHISWIFLYHSLATLTFLYQCLSAHGEPLNNFIKHYEPLNFDQKSLLSKHHRAKRSSNPGSLRLDLTALGRDLKLRLKRDTLVFSPDLSIETPGGAVGYDANRAYVGYVMGVPKSHVHGVVTSSGHFEGKIIMADDEVLVIEKASRYFSEPDLIARGFHSVVYNAADVEFDYSGTLCHSNKLHKQLHHYQINLTESRKDGTGNGNRFEENNHNYADWSDGNTRSQIDTEIILDKDLSLISFSRPENGNLDSELISDKFIQPGEIVQPVRPNKAPPNSRNKYVRSRRAVSVNDKTICELYLQADHLFYQHYGSNTETVIEQLTQHVQAANAIYKKVDFDKDGREDGIGFIIKKIKIHTDPDVAGYRYNGNFGVEKFLELVSEENYNFFCLSYMFTYRDFEGGTLGLAWTADLYNAGGICDKYNQYQGTWKSLNTGIVTVLNFGQFVPPTVSHVTLAHELGHNMGSPHDPSTESCTPGGDSGNFIMYARATSGDRPNNEQFSSCSIESMGPVIDSKGRDQDGCFVVYTDSMCGNKVVEDGEECDCGWDDECTEQCCNPQTSDSAKPQGCTLKPNAVCSPSVGLCCTEQCTIVPASANKLCRSASSCQDSAYCDGDNYNAICPQSAAKPNKTACGTSSVCYKGECTGSLCVVYGLESCQCAPRRDGDWHDPRLCHLCCKTPEPNAVCRSSHEFNDPQYQLPNTTAQPGSPCNNYQGFCDVFQKCREVDPSGPLQNIKKLLFSGEAIATLKQWLETYWYAAVLAVLGFILLMAFFIRFCSKTTLPQKVVKKVKKKVHPTRAKRPSEKSVHKKPRPSVSIVDLGV